ncbi:hypothetical protein DSECCO2_493410 [anaerobic digester metagenome]
MGQQSGHHGFPVHRNQFRLTDSSLVIAGSKRLQACFIRLLFRLPVHQPVSQPIQGRQQFGQFAREAFEVISLVACQFRFLESCQFKERPDGLAVLIEGQFIALKFFFHTRLLRGIKQRAALNGGVFSGQTSLQFGNDFAQGGGRQVPFHPGFQLSLILSDLVAQCLVFF